ncbi:hypothetical protein ACA910_007166 [Epithemia clementina (nom. ined.)]
MNSSLSSSSSCSSSCSTSCELLQGKTTGTSPPKRLLFGRDREWQILSDLLIHQIIRVVDKNESEPTPTTTEASTTTTTTTTATHHTASPTTTSDTTRTTTTTTTTVPPVALVHGVSGSGKTALCRQVLLLLDQQHRPNTTTTTTSSLSNSRDFLFLSGKFNQDSSVPFSALIQAFDSLYEQMKRTWEQPEKSDKGHSKQQQQKLQKQRDQNDLLAALAMEGKFVAEIIPSLAQFLRESQYADRADDLEPLDRPPEARKDNDDEPKHKNDHQNSSSNHSHSHNRTSQRLALGFSVFLRQFCTVRQRPVVLYMDDLQWADVNSLEILTALANTTDLDHFLLLCSYRDNRTSTTSTDYDATTTRCTSISQQQQLLHTSFLSHLANRPNVTRIALEHLDQSAVQEWLAHVLCWDNNNNNNNDDDDTDEKGCGDLKEFAALVHRKTWGNPFLIGQFLQRLEQEGILYVGASSLSLSSSSAARTMTMSGPPSQWQWDKTRLQQLLLLETTQSKVVVAEHVADWVTQRLQSVAPPCVRRLLQLAACLGFSMDRSVLQCLYYCHSTILLCVDNNDKAGDAPNVQRPEEKPDHADKASRSIQADQNNVDDFTRVLELAERGGFIETMGMSTVKFSHDRIRQMAYELVPVSVRNKVHYQIGKQLYEVYHHHGAVAAGTNKKHCNVSLSSCPYLLLITDQMNRGSMILLEQKSQDDKTSSSSSDRLLLARLNLEASKVARQQSAEGYVYYFLKQGFRLLIHSDWETSYDLVLDLYTRLAESECTRNNFAPSNQLVEGILRHARQMVHKASALAIQAKTKCRQMEFGQAIEKSRQALAVLGVQLKAPRLWNMILEFFKVKKLVTSQSSQKGDLFLENLPPMTNETIKQAMDILVATTVFCFAAQDHLSGGLVFCKMMQLTLQYGSCQETSTAVAAYAQLLAAMGQHVEAYHYATLALKLQPNQSKLYSNYGDGGSKPLQYVSTSLVVPTKKNNPLPTTTAMTQSTCLHFKLPLASALEPTLAGYRVGLETGDLFFGTLCLVHYVYLRMSCGLPLVPLLSDITNFIQQLRLLNQQEESICWLVPPLLLAKNLTGQEQVQLPSRELSWEKAVQQGILKDRAVIVAVDATPMGAVIRYFELFMGLVLQDFPVMERAIARILKLPKQQRRLPGTSYGNYFHALFDGLGGLAMYQATKRKKYLGLAKNGMADLKKMKSLNSLPLLQLVQAELAASRYCHDNGSKNNNNMNKRNNNKDAVKTLYDKAIVSSVRSGFCHFGAMAYERAGRFMLFQQQRQDERQQNQDNVFWAKEYFEQALKLYEEWGATVKVDAFVKEHADIFLQQQHKHHDHNPHERQKTPSGSGSCRTGSSSSCSSNNNSGIRNRSGSMILGRQRFESVASSLDLNQKDLALVVRAADASAVAAAAPRDEETTHSCLSEHR